MFCLLLFYATATVFCLYHDGDIMYEMGWRKPEPTLSLTQRIFIFLQHIGMAQEELAFDDAVNYTQLGNGLQHTDVIAVTSIRTPVLRVTYPAL